MAKTHKVNIENYFFEQLYNQVRDVILDGINNPRRSTEISASYDSDEITLCKARARVIQQDGETISVFHLRQPIK